MVLALVIVQATGPGAWRDVRPMGGGSEELGSEQRMNEDENGHIMTVKDEGQKYVIYAIP